MLRLLLVAVGAFCASSAVADVPRTDSGKPDLSGVYDIATLTPLQRPERYGDKRTVTPEEAAAIENYWKESLAKDLKPSDPNRSAPEEGGPIPHTLRVR